MRTVIVPIVPLAALLLGATLLDFGRPVGPQGAADVVREAEHQGLFWEDNTPPHRAFGRVVVSRTPVAKVEACNLNLFAEAPGQVVCYCRGERMGANFVSGRSVFWGKILAIGDPSLIRQLTGLDPER